MSIRLPRSECAGWSAAMAVLLLGCASARDGAAQRPPEGRSGLPAGYLTPEALPDSVALLPPPPEPGSLAQSLDDGASRRALALRGTPRWALATSDYDLSFPHAAATFDCALGVAISAVDTPRLYVLLRRSLADAALSARAAKDRYRRPRPLFVNHEPICAPEGAWEKRTSDGSYPSGHATAGWTWALVLAEAAPERFDAVLARGKEFGQSRVICNMHWQSDVDAGRLLGAATVARLHADPTFRADVEAAKEEVAAARASGRRPSTDCRAEADALAAGPPAAR